MVGVVEGLTTRRRGLRASCDACDVRCAIVGATTVPGAGGGGPVEIAREDAAVVLGGRLDGRCSAGVRELVYEYIERPPRHDVVIDLTQVESIDVTTLNLLAAAALR